MRRSKADAEQTRTDILDAAEQLFFTQGIAATSLEKIARTAGVTRGAFYWHFKDKTDLMLALRERYRLPQEDLIAAAAVNGHTDPLGLLESTGIEVLAVFEAQESRQRIFMITSKEVPMREGPSWVEQCNAEMFTLLSSLMVQARDNGTLCRDLSPKEAAVMLMVFMNGLLSEWLRSGKAFRLTEVGPKLFRKQMTLLRAAPVCGGLPAAPGAAAVEAPGCSAEPDRKTR